MRARTIDHFFFAASAALLLAVPRYFLALFFRSLRSLRAVLSFFCAWPKRTRRYLNVREDCEGTDLGSYCFAAASLS